MTNQLTAAITFFTIMTLLSCKKYEEDIINSESSLTLSVKDTAGVRADGASIIRLSLDKTIEIKKDLKIFFQSSKGILLNPEVSFEQNKAVCLLKVDQDTGTYFIKATVKDGSEVKLEKTINFVLRPAFPDSISLEPDRLTFNFSDNKQVSVTTYLLRNIGLVTKGRTATFRAYQIGILPTDTIAVGRFTGLFNNFSGVDGKLQTNVQFFSDVPGIDSNKIVYIRGHSNNDAGARVSAALALRYVR